MTTLSPDKPPEV